MMFKEVYSVDCFQNLGGELHVEATPLSEIAKQYGTPTFVYSKHMLVTAVEEFTQAFDAIPHRMHYAVKANSNLAILRLFAGMGLGFDVVSGFELLKVLKAGGDPAKIVFSGVGKTRDELLLAIEQQIASINIESFAEFEMIVNLVENYKRPAQISFRVNPSLLVSTHPYIATGGAQNKFGISPEDALQLAIKADKHPLLRLKGLACHVGSQITDTSLFSLAASCLLQLREKLLAKGISVEHLDLGGGLAVFPHQKPALIPYRDAILKVLKDTPVTLWLEPGRAFVAQAGVLLSEVIALKPGTPSFAIIDAGMNDWMRPALYQAKHPVEAVKVLQTLVSPWQVVGPICESADVHQDVAHLALVGSDLVVIRDTGAYGMSLSSNYNSRPRAAEVLVSGKSVQLIRRRERFEDLTLPEDEVNL